MSEKNYGTGRRQKFDTITSSIALQFCRTMYSEWIMRWVESLLADCCTTLATNRKAIDFFTVTRNIPQGSPILLLYHFLTLTLLESILNAALVVLWDPYTASTYWLAVKAWRKTAYFWSDCTNSAERGRIHTVPALLQVRAD